MRQPTSFTQVEGWRESFGAALRRINAIRASSVFPEVPQTLCTIPVRPLTLRDWSVLDVAGNPLTAGGFPGAEHAINVVWILRRQWLWAGRGRLSRFLRRVFARMILARFKNRQDLILAEVTRFLDDAFLDSPGRFSEEKKASFNPTQTSRVSLEISLCSEVMSAYPSFRYEDLRSMPLAQFWQWLHEARAKANSEYRPIQLTDKINADACSELNRMRAAARKEKQDAR